ncbi:HEAT repeat domain-containing protein [Leptothoe sp. EHU-05/26/07-4]
MIGVPHNPDGKPLTLDQALININQTADSGLRYYAAWWLGKMRICQPVAIDALLLALEDKTNRSPDGGYPLRRNAITALGKIGYGDDRVVPAVIHSLRCEDYYVREKAAQTLECLGDSVAVPPLVELLDGSVEKAVQAPDKPHLVQPYNSILEALGTLGDKKLANTIAPFLTHDVPQVRNAAARAMYQITGEAQYAERLVDVLSHDQLQLRRAALMDLGAIGYLAGATAIANTLAENSMKLIALRGILEHQISFEIQSGEDTSPISDDSRQVMELMDSLL